MAETSDRLDGLTDYVYDDQDNPVSITQGALPFASYPHNALGARSKTDAGDTASHYDCNQVCSPYS